MAVYVVLLRAVNVGGTGKLPMTDLKAMCLDEGFGDVKTYIASGNVVLTSDRSEAEVKAALEARLADYFGKVYPVFVRTAEQIRQVLEANPFADAPPKYTYATFLDATPPADAIEHAKNRTTEEIALGVREIYVAYGEGIGASRLQLPAAAAGTARNMNTVAKLTDLALART